MLKNKRFLNWGIVFLLIILPGCNNNIPPDKSFDVISYRDIPGVTAEEINAIEALKVQYDYFIYGMLECTESFYNMDGNIDGFTRLVCDWLTDIFGIPFIPRNYIWTDLLDGLRDGTIDFSGYLMPTPGRRETYNMTDPIAQRMVKYYRLRDSAPLSEIRETRLPKYALVTDAASTHTVLQYAAYEFEPVYVEVYTDAYELMINGDVDALITVGVLETGFGNDVMTEDFMPPIFASTSFAAQNPAFQPFIGVVQKALENGAIHYFHELYRQGYREYMRHTLLSWLNEEESVFLKTNPVISLIGERDNYPLSFFNTRYQEWQGIAFDVLREVNLLTGLEYKVINEPSAEWHELLIMLEDGDASMVTHLARTKERENRFLWPGSVFFTDQPVLISKNEFPNISISEVFLVKVGLVRDSVHDELFRTWFPEHNNMFTYDSMGESFAALIRGEIDMVMNTQSGLLYLTNFQELAGYKANIIFNNSLSITFGLNRDEPILLSIIDKSMQLIDTEMISGQWLRRTYDYRLKLVQAQRPWLVGAVITLAVILILLMIIFLNDRLKRKIIADKAAAEMASRAKSEFLATMSHEIRTPMNSIMGFAELATDSESVSETRDYLGKITDSTKWLLHIINDILDISKIESGKMELEKVPFDLRDVFSRCQSVILPSVKEKGLDLSIYAEPSIGKKLLG
ncbi:MAG: transporter substrate-binding domain-containing protein, partial [Treponema sp.]|nr:transporter substrate-binding domain-containing protein [Treponema sp.]